MSSYTSSHTPRTAERYTAANDASISSNSSSNEPQHATTYETSSQSHRNRRTKHAKQLRRAAARARREAARSKKAAQDSSKATRDVQRIRDAAPLEDAEQAGKNDDGNAFELQDTYWPEDHELLDFTDHEWENDEPNEESDFVYSSGRFAEPNEFEGLSAEEKYWDYHESQTPWNSFHHYPKGY